MFDYKAKVGTQSLVETDVCATSTKSQNNKGYKK